MTAPQTRSHNQAVPVLGYHVAQVAQCRLLPVALAVQAGIWIHGRGVRVVTPLLTSEVHLRVAPATLWPRLAVPGPCA